MVKIMENPIRMDDLGGTIIFGNTHIPVVPHEAVAEVSKGKNYIIRKNMCL